MTFTWDTSSLSSSALQQVRLTIGDRDENYALLTDEEIEYRLDEHSDDVLSASIACIQDILAKIARDVDRSNVGMSSTRSQMTTHYQDLLNKLEERSGAQCQPYVGGTSDDEADSISSDSDYRQAHITIGWGKNNG